jgi:tripartite-type tricarboxylate transporter receptor subunit TctC
MEIPRRKFLQLAAGAVALPAAPRVGWAQSYPTRPVRIVVGFPAGNSPDIVARLVAQWLSERLNQQFLVENRPGAGSNIATEAVIRAPADGYTLLLVTAVNATNTALYDDLKFDFIRDIAPVASVLTAPFVMVVNPLLPAKTVPEFIAYAKANPGKIAMASAGIGSSPHIYGELFKSMAGLELLHVPYRGPYVPDVLAGRVQVTFMPIPQALGYIRSGQLRALAVTSAKGVEALPHIPPIGDFVPNYEASGFLGIGAPRSTPAEVVNRLNEAVDAGLADPKIKAQLFALGDEPLSMTPAEFGKLIAAEADKWGKVIRAANIKAE